MPKNLETFPITALNLSVLGCNIEENNYMHFLNADIVAVSYPILTIKSLNESSEYDFSRDA